MTKTLTGKSTADDILNADYDTLCAFYNDEQNKVRFPKLYAVADKAIDWHHASQDAALYRAESNFGC